MGYPDMMRDILAQTRRENLSDRRRLLGDRSIIEPKTGLYSRVYFDLRLDEEIARSRLYGNKLSLMILHAGPFPMDGGAQDKQISEETMRTVAGIINDCLDDTIALAFVYDKDQFAVIMPESAMYEAVMTADHIRETIVNERFPGVVPRAGIAQYKDQDNADDLIQAAEEALHGY